MKKENAINNKQRAVLLVLLVIMLSGFGFSLVGMFAEGLYTMIIGIIGYFIYNAIMKS